MSDETAFERLNSENRMRLSSEQIVEFERLGDDEGISRMQSVAEWLSRVNVQNHDGVRVTPTLSALLTQTEDVEGTTSQLDGLRAKTRRGLFDADDELMRELEYHRFRVGVRSPTGLAGGTGRAAIVVRVAHRTRRAARRSACTDRRGPKGSPASGVRGGRTPAVSA